jgi:hypothetical protein
MGHAVLMKNIHRAHVGDKIKGKLTKKMKVQHVQKWFSLESWFQINFNI